LPISGSGGLTDQSVYVIFAFFIGAVILAPVLEEVIFRAILFARLRQKFSFLPAAAITAVGHAVMHGDIATLPGLTVVFIIFAYLYERTGCLWLPIIAHGVHNLLVLTAAFMALS
jgi:membrane protease YdiL (CAAX protease family)